MVYENVFFWIGMLSSAFFILLGMSVFSAWIMNMVWRKFQDGKQLADIIFCWREFGRDAIATRAASMMAEKKIDDA